MKYDKHSRRMFLQGLGGSLFSIPFLSSMLPREAWAQACAVRPRFFMMASQFAPSPRIFLGSLAGTERRGPNVNITSLTGKSNISRFINSDFNGVLSKMSVLRGIDHYGPAGYGVTHSFTSGAAACPNTWLHSGQKDNPLDIEFKLTRENVRDHSVGPILNLNTIDVVMSKSNKIYPNGNGTRRRLISLTPLVVNPQLGIYDWGQETNGSWEKGIDVASSKNVVEALSTQELYNRFVKDFTGGTMGGTTPPPSTSAAKKDVIQAVYDDYRAVRDSSQISAFDKANLENYMGMIFDLIGSLSSGTTTTPTQSSSCYNPQINYGQDNDSLGRFKNQADVIIAAMACDLLRVANLHCGFLDAAPDRTGEHIHNYHHSLNGWNKDENGNELPVGSAPTQFEQMWETTGRKVAYVMNQMNRISDGTGSLLDNSIVYWYSQQGMAQLSGSSHSENDMGIIIGGGGAGALQMGYYIDFRHVTEKWTGGGGRVAYDGAPGLPVNNLLVTLSNAYGIPASEYERPGQPGWGAYANESSIGGWLYGLTRMSDTYRNQILNSRRSNLPFLFLKSVC